MTGVLATVGGEAADRFSGLGIQLVMLASVALFLGALRLVLAKRTGARLLLVAGTLFLAIGITALLLESSGAFEMGYYPEWKKDIEATDMTIEEVQEEDPYYYSGPAWWEAPVWWGQRLLRLTGMALATVGFFLEGRTITRKRSRRAA